MSGARNYLQAGFPETSSSSRMSRPRSMVVTSISVSTPSSLACLSCSTAVRTSCARPPNSSGQACHNPADAAQTCSCESVKPSLARSIAPVTVWTVRRPGAPLASNAVHPLRPRLRRAVAAQARGGDQRHRFTLIHDDPLVLVVFSRPALMKLLVEMGRHDVYGVVTRLTLAVLEWPSATSHQHEEPTSITARLPGWYDCDVRSGVTSLAAAAQGSLGFLRRREAGFVGNLAGRHDSQLEYPGTFCGEGCARGTRYCRRRRNPISAVGRREESVRISPTGQRRIPTRSVFSREFRAPPTCRSRSRSSRLQTTSPSPTSTCTPFAAFS